MATAAFVDDFVTSVTTKVKQLSEEVVPKISKNKIIATSSDTTTSAASIPPTLDIRYITERLLAGSQPTEPLNPTYEDKGRDTYWDNAHFHYFSSSYERQQQQERQQRQEEPQCQKTQTEQEVKHQQQAGESTTQLTASTHTNAALSVTNVHDDDDEKTYVDELDREDIQQQQQQQQQQQNSPETSSHNDHIANSRGNISNNNNRRTINNNNNNNNSTNNKNVPSSRWNSPATLATFLEQRHSSKFLAFHLSDTPPDDRTLLLFRRQIVQFGWKSPCHLRSETPTISQLLEICYAIHAYLNLSPENVVFTCCKNGKTRTAIVMACYLKFAGHVKQTRDGFYHFLQRTATTTMSLTDMQNIVNHLPPSLHTFFRNFDDCVELGCYINSKPLLLRAIALQGIPVEDKPCLDIWDGQQRHVYSSHPELWNDLVPTNPTVMTNTQNTNNHKQEEGVQNKQQQKHHHHSSCSQWADEEGFYKVNIMLEGDFCILCRFGGVHAEDSSHDPSKLLFRYSNTTGFLSAGGPYELPPSKVDMMRRYAQFFEEDDFLLSLLFEAHWNCSSPEEAKLLKRDCSPEFLPKVLHGRAAMERGWHLITHHHSACPATEDVTRFYKHFHKDLNGCPNHIISLALQISNFDWMDAYDQLYSGSLSSWWKGLHNNNNDNNIMETFKENDKNNNNLKGDNKNIVVVEEKKSEESSSLSLIEEGNIINARPPFLLVDPMKDATQNIMNILGTVDIKSRFKSLDCPAQGEQQSSWHRKTTPSSPSSPSPPSSGEQQQKQQHHYQQEKVPSTSTAIINSPLKNTQTQPPSSAFLSKPEVSTYYCSPHIIMPHPGDAVNAFGEYYKQIHEKIQQQRQRQQQRRRQQQQRQQQYPQAPIFHKNNKGTNSSTQQQPLSTAIVQYPTTKVAPLDNPMNSVAVEMLLKVHHPSIDLKDLVDLLSDSQSWNSRSSLTADIELLDEDKERKNRKSTGKSSPAKSLSNENSEGNRNDAHSGGSDGDDDEEEDGIEILLGDSPEFSKYFKMLETGSSKEDVINALIRDGKDPSVAEMDPGKSLKSLGLMSEEKLKSLGALPAEEDEEDQDEKNENENEKDNHKKEKEEPALKDDPEYSKYFKMLKMGMAKEQVKHALTRDQKDPSIVDLDPNKSLKAQRPEEEKGEKKGGADEKPLKEDPEYSKYFKMLKMGMPKEQVQHALTRDGKDPSIVDLDPQKSLKSQRPQKEGKEEVDDGPPLKEDPDYSKYFKMLKMGMPKEQVQHALTRDGKDPSIVDMDPDKSLKSQQKKEEADNDPPLKDDPDYAKYFKMLKMGMAKEQVQHALTRDGKDTAVVDMDPEKSLKSQQKGHAVDDGPPLKEDPEYKKYFKMLDMGLPMGAVQNALTRDGKDPSIMDLDPNKSIKSQLSSKEEDTGPPLKEDPDYKKYFNMLKMGLPVGAVKNALTRDGKDPGIIDLDPEKTLKSQMEEKDTGTPLKEDPEYSKYFKMLSMGLPLGAVKNALTRDGKDPNIMDLDPTKSVDFQLKKKSGGGKGARPKSVKKKRVRRKKIYWNPIKPELIKEDSIWNIVRGSVNMEKLKYDVKEFEDLFTESADPKDRKKNADKKKTTKQAKKSVQVIDGKRSMNGGIILLRLRMDYKLLAKMVDTMESGKLDSTQLKGLKEYFPTSEEKSGLQHYLKPGEASEQAYQKVYADLSECEKYMVTIMDIPHAIPKFDCMLFRVQFQGRHDELADSIKVVESACDQVRHSEKLRKIMAMILTLVNQINTGGETSGAHGFTLEALLKLNEAKAFDKKTSVLQYLAKLVKRNDEDLLKLKEDLKMIPNAELVILDTLCGDLKTLEDELKGVHKTAQEDAARLEKEGKLKPMSLDEIAHQRSSVKAISNVPQFNQVKNHTGRTSMERFTINAAASVEDMVKTTDKVKDKYTRLLQYFGEDAKMPSNEFFATMKRFIKEFEQAVEHVDKVEKALLKEKKKAEKKAAAAAKKAQAQKAKEKRKDNKVVADPGDSKTAAGTGAATAAAATIGKKKNIDGTAVPPVVGAGIGALAAAAATRKNAVATGKKAPPAGVGGIAAMAAAAARKKDGVKTAPSHGGIAAMAAAAARKKDNPASAPSIGGIAAMAAAAARKKDSADTTTSAGGIAAMAAAAARKKESFGASPQTTGGIAAMAAAAARNKENSKALTSAGGIAAIAAAAARKKENAKSAPPAGGIAAMAAAAARKKEKTEAAGGIAAMAAAAARKKENADSLAPAGGIAAMAAAAARKKEKTEAAPSAGGIAAMAAAAARKKENADNAVSAGGIAAMAAAAARKKEKAEAVPSAGGIAAMAAAAARKKENADNPASAGGIAAMAAAAARKKEKYEAAPSAGGIAAMAAAAARKKEIAESAPPSGGGIAAMAAAAARKKENAKAAPPTGGIAAMAAAAARKKETYDNANATKTVASHAGIVPDGISAMAASAVRNGEESVANTNSWRRDINGRLTRLQEKIADARLYSEANAAKAGRKRENAALPAGGIAAMAAAAARKKETADVALSSGGKGNKAGTIDEQNKLSPRPPMSRQHGKTLTSDGFLRGKGNQRKPSRDTSIG